jgi:hypothetical protein
MTDQLTLVSKTPHGPTHLFFGISADQSFLILLLQHRRSSGSHSMKVGRHHLLRGHRRKFTKCHKARSILQRHHREKRCSNQHSIRSRNICPVSVMNTMKLWRFHVIVRHHDLPSSLTRKRRHGTFRRVAVPTASTSREDRVFSRSFPLLGPRHTQRANRTGGSESPRVGKGFGGTNTMWGFFVLRHASHRP